MLDAIVKTTRIFEAWSDEPWVNEGAAVRVSLVGFGNTLQLARLDGKSAAAIHADLTPASDESAANDLTSAHTLAQNERASFIGGMKKGQFDIEGDLARAWLGSPSLGASGNAAVLRPWMNGLDVTRRAQDMWIVDFGVDRTVEEASLYEAPFEHVRVQVKPARDQVQNPLERAKWWLHARPAPELRAAVRTLPRFALTARVAKHRLFTWVSGLVVVDGQLVVVARADDTTFGLLHSRFHELWSLRLGTSLEDRPRYTPTTCFETFPFPAGLTPADTAHQRTERLEGTGTTPAALIPADLTPEVRRRAEPVARAAARLVTLRDAWLNPPEWTERVPEVVPLGMTTSPYPDRIVARPGFEEPLAKRTLTNLYNQRPAWLVQAHEALDAAVAAAYGWTDYTPAMPDEEILRRLLALNRERARAQA
ncbi:MAG: adenine methyltransferase [Rubrivivax sp.]|nr:adenine methyltransferase [Rubrivivax sp.]